MIILVIVVKVTIAAKVAGLGTVQDIQKHLEGDGRNVVMTIMRLDAMPVAQQAVVTTMKDVIRPAIGMTMIEIVDMAGGLATLKAIQRHPAEGGIVVGN